jgi:hypothetical protein
MNKRGTGDRGIPVIEKDVSYQVFLNEYLRPLEPCIISGLTDEWTASKEWTIGHPLTGELIPNFSKLKQAFGEYGCCVTFCNETDSNGETVQREMSVVQFIDSIHEHNTTQKTYLKDFHFMRVNPSLKPPYLVPKFFEGMASLLFFTNER